MLHTSLSSSYLASEYISHTATTVFSLSPSFSVFTLLYDTNFSHSIMRLFTLGFTKSTLSDLSHIHRPLTLLCLYIYSPTILIHMSTYMYYLNSSTVCFGSSVDFAQLCRVSVRLFSRLSRKEGQFYITGFTAKIVL